MIAWSPAVPPLLLAAAVITVAGALWWSLRALLPRLGRRQAWFAWLPRAVLGLLLLAALAGPRWRHEATRPPSGSLTVLIDTSSSMDLADGRSTSRLQRARQLAAAVQQAAPAGMTTEVLGFDTRLRAALPAQVPPGERPGDPAALLAGLGNEPRLASRAACVVLTDGGDEPIPTVQPPDMPVWIIGLGPTTAHPDNLAIADLSAPATAEANQDVPVAVEVTAEGSAAFVAQLAAIPVTLEERRDGAWSSVGETTLDLRAGRARAAFTRRWDTVGRVQLRARVPLHPNEASPLDNRRDAAVELRIRGLHVLYFTREIGAEFKALRQELGRDPGLTFTALLRTVASNRQGDRYALLGERIAGDEALEHGFPTDAAGLGRYGVIIVGAFAPGAWHSDEAEALKRHVDGGGAVVFLAGDECAAGGVLAPLLPMVPATGLERGSFPLSVPAGATGQPVVEGLAPLLVGAAVDSVVRCDPPRPGASVLLASSAGGRVLPLIAVQTWGRGRCALVASNTLWRLAGPGPSGEAYGRLWRQLARWLGGTADEGGLLRVRWDQERYLPGGEAIGTIIPTTPGLTLAATITPPDGTPQPLALEPAADAGSGAVRIRLRFAERGEWHFRVEALRDGQVAETMERTLSVAPLQEEGSRLVGDRAGLARAASACGGSYADESEATALIAALTTRLNGSPVQVESAPLASPWLLAAVLALLIAEWTIRRRLGLV
jgi:hypothetical protein